MKLIDVTGMKFVRETDSIETREDLVRYVERLREDLLSNKEDWENPTLERFLDAMSAQINSLDQLYKNLKKETPVVPSWKVFAEILSGAKIRE